MTADLWIALLSGAICLRILLYRRGNSAFKRHCSAIAYLIIVGTGSLTLALLTQRIRMPDSPITILVAWLLVCLLLAALRSRGNVARLFEIWR